MLDTRVKNSSPESAPRRSPQLNPIIITPPDKINPLKPKPKNGLMKIKERKPKPKQYKNAHPYT